MANKNNSNKVKLLLNAFKPPAPYPIFPLNLMYEKNFCPYIF